MNREQEVEAAVRLIKEHNKFFEYSSIYEDEQLEAREESWDSIYKIIRSAKFSVTIDGREYEW